MSRKQEPTLLEKCTAAFDELYKENDHLKDTNTFLRERGEALEKLVREYRDFLALGYPGWDSEVWAKDRDALAQGAKELLGE